LLNEIQFIAKLVLIAVFATDFMGSFFRLGQIYQGGGEPIKQERTGGYYIFGIFWAALWSLVIWYLWS